MTDNDLDGTAMQKRTEAATAIGADVLARGARFNVASSQSEPGHMRVVERNLRTKGSRRGDSNP